MKKIIAVLVFSFSSLVLAKDTTVKLNGKEVNCKLYTISTEGENRAPSVTEKINSDLSVSKTVVKGRINAYANTLAHPSLDYKEADMTGTLKTVGTATMIEGYNLTDSQVDECFDANAKAKLKKNVVKR